MMKRLKTGTGVCVIALGVITSPALAFQRPVLIMRYGTAKERWTAAPKLSFDFDYR